MGSSMAVTVGDVAATSFDWGEVQARSNNSSGFITYLSSDSEQ